MRARDFQWIGLLLVLILAGCSTGPRFDARQPDTDTGGLTGNDTRYPKLASLDESSFRSIDSTNEIRPEWLKPPTDFFRLGPGDVLEIELLGEATSRATATVGPDGKIYYSLLPGLFVWGLSLTETKDLLEKELAKYIRVKPEAAIYLRTVGSKRIWILGNVSTPGAYALTAPVTLLEALVAAGGPTAVAGTTTGMPDLRNSFLMRKGQILKVDFHKLLSEGDLSQNIYLQAEDFIYLRSSTTRNVYVMGAVASPSIVPYTDQLTLLSAIATAGGTIEYAQVSHAAIIRGSLASPKIAVVDYKAIYKGEAPDLKLQPGDIVYVPFVFYRRLALFAEAMLRQFVYTLASNEGYNASGTRTVTTVAPTPAATTTTTTTTSITPVTQ